MRRMKWSVSHSVFVTEIDDEHKEIFAAVAELGQAAGEGAELPEVVRAAERAMTCIAEHFAHEERLMRAARYESLGWHKRRHDAAAKQVAEFVARIEAADPGAAAEMVEYLDGWLWDHTRVADRMMGAALRNYNLCKIAIHAATKRVDSCAWVTADGEPFDPPRSGRSL